MKNLLFASTCILALSVAPLRAQDQPSQEPVAPKGQAAPAGGSDELKPQKPAGAGTKATTTPQRAGEGEGKAAQGEGQAGEGEIKRETPAAETGNKGAAKGAPAAGKAGTEAPKAESTQQPKREEQPKAGETKAPAGETKGTATKSGTEPSKAGETKTQQQPKAETGTAGGTARKPAAPEGEKAVGGQGSEGTSGTKAGQNSGETRPAEKGTSATRNTGENQGSVKAEGKINLDERKAGDLHERILGRYRGESAHLNLRLDIGVAVPESVRIRELPPEIVSEYPEFRGYDFFVEEDEVVIVRPGTREVVEIIGGGGRGSMASEGGGRRVHFGRQQDEQIRSVITSDREALAGGRRGPMLRAPESAEIRPLPERIAASMPDAEGYGYFVDREGRIIIVDRSSREVVDIVE